jgi:hypothetical protein
MKSVAEVFRSYGVLDAEGRHTNGTDKETNHRYGDAYERLVESMPYTSRLSIKLMMEVGVADGSSILAWSEVFPNATCVGLDIHHSDRAHGDRIEFYLGNQRSKADCERAAAGRLFDLIVDDATHDLDSTLLTLYWLWPFVRPGGLYVVEEWPNPDCDRILGLWPCAELVDTVGPFGGLEPLVVMRK